MWEYVVDVLAPSDAEALRLPTIANNLFVCEDNEAVKKKIMKDRKRECASLFQNAPRGLGLLF